MDARLRLRGELPLCYGCQDGFGIAHRLFVRMTARCPVRGEDAGRTHPARSVDNIGHNSFPNKLFVQARRELRGHRAKGRQLRVAG